ncbi:hypothetical protein PghCCS26_46460 [Paenibacillus glycanilyticus]|uniref:Uncharacterized protein n=1 Tax=Paenibacillus glycanilyticus TaxID=126569 RepID=A0ABQ6NQZ6_9BACL|nr:hypothetical protein [Paenibacillus glycanilyticus]GMK47516.1 hypothetical protein PghCCS26_46460 [Paenibacillus glycanilyticus]
MLKQLLNPTSQPSYHKSIVFSDRFLQAFFAIEHEYDNREMFRIRANGKGRLLAHMTKADLQLATMLHVYAYNGKLEEVPNRYYLYQRMEELYEEPVNKDQFYAAFEKFLQLGLLGVSQDELLGHLELTLPHAIDPETGKAGRLVLLPSLVFGRSFTCKPLALQKLYYYSCMRQGQDYDRLLQWNFEHLAPFMHRYESSHVKRLLKQAGEMTYAGVPLFSVIRTESNVVGEPKAVYQVNKALLPRYERGGHYHERLPLKKSYKRLLSRLEGLLEHAGIGEYAVMDEGRPMRQLALLLKDKTDSYWHIVVDRLSRMYVETGRFTANVLDTIKAELHDRFSAFLLGTLKQTGLFSYLSSGQMDVFCQSMRGVPKAAYRRACWAAAATARANYSRPAVYNTLDYYKRSVQLDELEEILPLENYRRQALDVGADPESFFVALLHAHDFIRIKPIDEINQWLEVEINRLPKWKPIIDPPAGFDLSSFIQSHMNLQLS